MPVSYTHLDVYKRQRFNFAWEWLPVSGLSVKDFIAPSSFRFGDGRMFQMGGKFGAVSFLQIAAPELSDRMLADFMEAENGIVVNLHIQSIDHNEAIKTIKMCIRDSYLQVGMYTEMIFPQKGVRFIAINDGVDSAQGDNDFAPLRNIFNEWLVLSLIHI